MLLSGDFGFVEKEDSVRLQKEMGDVERFLNGLNL